MRQHRPLGTSSPIFSQNRGQIEPQFQTPAKGDVEPKSHKVPVTAGATLGRQSTERDPKQKRGNGPAPSGGPVTQNM